jgi:FkbM family methyltransferase
MNQEDRLNRTDTDNSVMVVGKVDQMLVRTLDSIVEAKSTDSVSFIKIDMEGLEWSLFRGAGIFLQNNRPIFDGEFTPSSM